MFHGPEFIGVVFFSRRFIGVVVHKGRTVNQAKGGLGLASFRNLDTGLILCLNR